MHSTQLGASFSFAGGRYSLRLMSRLQAQALVTLKAQHTLQNHSVESENMCWNIYISNYKTSKMSSSLGNIMLIISKSMS